MKYHFANVINSFSNILDGGDGKIKHFLFVIEAYARIYGMFCLCRLVSTTSGLLFVGVFFLSAFHSLSLSSNLPIFVSSYLYHFAFAPAPFFFPFHHVFLFLLLPTVSSHFNFPQLLCFSENDIGIIFLFVCELNAIFCCYMLVIARFSSR